MSLNHELDEEQRREDILVWKYGIHADLSDDSLVITGDDLLEYFHSGGMTSLPVVSYRKEHPYLDHAGKLKKAIAILCSMTEKQIDEFLTQNRKNKKQ